MDFTIDPKLLKFDAEVTPAIGDMSSYTQEVIEKNQKVSQTSAQCGDGLSGAYVTNNTGKAVKPYKVLSEGCKTIAEEMQDKVMTILADCAALASVIAQLKKIAAEAAALQAIISQKQNSDPPQNADAEIAQLKALYEEFKALHEQAKAMLAALQGADATISDMEPTNGSLSVDPNISVSIQKGTSGKDQYYNYTLGDQSITSVNS